jgi:nitronate monooxygenase
VVGTRFQASLEALVPAEIAKAIVEAHGSDTERSRVLDIGRGAPWPARYPGRTLRNAFLDRWRDHEAVLRDDDAARTEFRAAIARGDLDAVPVWAGEAVDLITDLPSATELVGMLVGGAERALARATRPFEPVR